MIPRGAKALAKRLGKGWVPGAVATWPRDRPRPGAQKGNVAVARLSDRLVEVVVLDAEGRMDKICSQDSDPREALRVSLETERRHRDAVRAKLATHEARVAALEAAMGGEA